MAFPPNTFASQSGNVPASELDANFTACMPASAAADTILGNPTGGTANAIAMSGAQAYGLIKGSIPWEVVGYMGGAQGGASWQVMRYQPSVASLIAAGAGSAGVAATGSTVFTIADNGSAIGTATFAVSGTTATVAWSVGLPYTLLAGHVLTITGPGSADATLANANFTISGNRA